MLKLKKIMGEAPQKKGARNIESIFKEEVWPLYLQKPWLYNCPNYQSLFDQTVALALNTAYKGKGYDNLQDLRDKHEEVLGPFFQYVQDSVSFSRVYRGLCVSKNSTYYRDLGKRRKAQKLDLIFETAQAFTTSRRVGQAFSRGAFEVVGHKISWDFNTKVEHLGLLLASAVQPQQVLFFSVLLQQERGHFVSEVYEDMYRPTMIKTEEEVMVFSGGPLEAQILEERVWLPKEGKWRNAH